MLQFLSDHSRTTLPYTSGGGCGGSPYGRRRGIFSSQNTVTNVLAVLFLASFSFAVYSHVRASAANTDKAALTRALSDAHEELHTVKARAARGANEVDQIRMTYEHTQRRLSEVTSQLQRKEAELISKEQVLKQHIQERGVVDQHRSGREAELSKMVEDLRQEILRTDNVVEALDKKIAQMEEKHAARENDWHVLAQTWVKYEQDLHEQYKRCTDEVSKLRNLTVTVNDTGTVPEAEPKLRPETDFHHIGVEVPVHQAHRFDPLPQTSPPPSPGVPSSGAGTASDLPLPEPKIRDSIIQMTDGRVGLPTDLQQQQPAGQVAPSPVQSHHHDVYHGDFHDPHADEHWQGHYDHYHGHYDSYDPMDQYWLRDSHGDWNADDAAGRNDHGDHHHAGDDVGARDQNPHHGQNTHHEQHGQNVHHAQHDQHQGDKAAYQQHYPDHTVQKPTTTDPHLHEHAGQAHPEAHRAHPGDHWQPPQPMHGNDHHQQQHGGAAQQHHVPPTMPGMGMEHHAHHTHVQHPPNTWDHHEQHNQQHYQQQQQHYQQQQQHYLQQQQQYQQQQQQYQQQHSPQHQEQQHIQHSAHYEGHQQQHHPTGDLAYKMGW